LIIEQFFHEAEHVAQMYQFTFLGMSADTAHGFLWFLDDEWNHFTFNALYFVGTLFVFSQLLRGLDRAGIKRKIAHTGYMLVFFVLEGWHMCEHTYRIIHHIQGLCDECSGIIDTLTGIDRITLHFWLNFFALLFPVAVYMWYGMPALLRRGTKTHGA
jgi:hypothetical protein